jgi:Guanine nucleotide exchange factor in Golgi transport N-terminal/Dimerisation and cyclophilin-binding domain of Mon2
VWPQVLAMCFRLLSAKNPATIVNTASAIVRQSIALVFEHAAAHSATPTPAATVPNTPSATAAAPRTPAARSAMVAQNVGSSGVSAAFVGDARGAAAGAGTPATAGAAAGVAAGGAAAQPPAEVAVMLLRELCLMCRGHGSELLECRPLSATFLLDVMCEVLRTHTALFRKRATFLAVLREDVCGTVLHILKQQLEADTEHVQARSLIALACCTNFTESHEANQHQRQSSGQDRVGCSMQSLGGHPVLQAKYACIQSATATASSFADLQACMLSGALSATLQALAAYIKRYSVLRASKRFQLLTTSLACRLTRCAPCCRRQRCVSHTTGTSCLRAPSSSTRGCSTASTARRTSRSRHAHARVLSTLQKNPFQ